MCRHPPRARAIGVFWISREDRKGPVGNAPGNGTCKTPHARQVEIISYIDEAR